MGAGQGRGRAVAAVTYRIDWRPHARKAFLALDKPVRRRIGEAVEALAADPRPAAAKMITGAHGVLRIRVGDYRCSTPSTRASSSSCYSTPGTAARSTAGNKHQQASCASAFWWNRPADASCVAVGAHFAPGRYSWTCWPCDADGVRGPGGQRGKPKGFDRSRVGRSAQRHWLSAVQQENTATGLDSGGLVHTSRDGDLRGWTQADVLPADGMQEVRGSNPLSSTQVRQVNSKS